MSDKNSEKMLDKKEIEYYNQDNKRRKHKVQKKN